jgi:predicted phage terminase large subunit-like protein
VFQSSTRNDPDVLTAEEIKLLTPEEMAQYREILERAELEVDLENAARGLTLDLEDFERQAWAIVEPDTPLVWGWEYELLCEWLTLIANGDFKRLHPDKLGLIVNIPPRTGKLLAHSTPVFTPHGWRLHGDLKVGDLVYGRNGQMVRVLAVGPEGHADHIVEFTDGCQIRCHGAHEWIVFDRAKSRAPQRILETQQMLCGWEPPRPLSTTGPKPGAHGLWLGNRGERGGRARFQVDGNVPLLGRELVLPIPPYVFGAWLGDGSSTKACLTHAPTDQTHIERVESLGFPRSAVSIHRDTGVWTTYFRGGLHGLLRRVGAYGNKHIPTVYLCASYQQRLDLLAGLIDTDGTRGECGRYAFSNTNKRLADDVACLVRSLGWRVSRHEAEPTEGGAPRGLRIVGRKPVHVVAFNPTCCLPLALARKRSTIIDPAYRRRGISAIAACEPESGRCIQVEDGVYLVGETMVPTHNSTFLCVNFPVWAWTRRPSRRFLFGSHSLSLAGTHNAKRNYLIESQWFQERFRNRFRLSSSGSLLTQNDRTGRFQVSSIGSKHTGFGGLMLVGDDLLDREDQYSEAVKKHTNSWLDSSFSKMLDDAVRGVTVHISQRLAVDDPTGHLVGEDLGLADSEKQRTLRSQWIHIKIPREAPRDEEYKFPISGRIHLRPKGDILQAERCPPAVLARLKAKPREWANQEQQEPTPEAGALLNRSRLRWYKASDPLPTFFQVVESVDCNFAEGKDNDLVAIQKWALVYNRRYLLDRRTEQIGYIATKQAIKETARGGHTVAWMSVPMPPATQVLIENKANGPAIAEELRADPKFGLAVIEYNPKGSKTQRFIAATGDVEGGLIFLPEDAPWIGELLKVLCDYAGEGSVLHDDDCDSFSQFINWSRQMQYGLLGFLEKQAAEEAGTREVHRCVIQDDTGADVVLEWDEVKELWFDPKNPERTYAAGPAEAEASESSVNGSAAAEASETSASAAGS